MGVKILRKYFVSLLYKHLAAYWGKDMTYSIIGMITSFWSWRSLFDDMLQYAVREYLRR